MKLEINSSNYNVWEVPSLICVKMALLLRILALLMRMSLWMYRINKDFAQ